MKVFNLFGQGPKLANLFPKWRRPAACLLGPLHGPTHPLNAVSPFLIFTAKLRAGKEKGGIMFLILRREEGGGGGGIITLPSFSPCSEEPCSMSTAHTAFAFTEKRKKRNSSYFSDFFPSPRCWLCMELRGKERRSSSSGENCRRETEAKKKDCSRKVSKTPR